MEKEEFKNLLNYKLLKINNKNALWQKHISLSNSMLKKYLFNAVF
jgi:hypothetical protein